MPSQLALVICIIFVLLSLFIEKKGRSRTTKALWLPAIWFMAINSKPIGYWLGIPGSEGGSPADRLFLSVILVLGFIAILRRKNDLEPILSHNKLLWLVLAYMLISIFWSNIQFISLKRWIREVIAVVMAFLVATEPSPRNALESVLRRATYVLIPFSVVLVKYYSQLGRAYGRWSGKEMWIGVTTQKNALGRLLVIAVFFLIWSLLKRDKNALSKRYVKYIDGLTLIMALWLLKGPSGAFSATAVVSLSAGLFMFIVLMWCRKRRIFPTSGIIVTILSSVIIFGIITFMTQGFEIGNYATYIGRDSTLTGRTVVWSKLTPVAMEHLFLGHGLGGFWTEHTRELFEISEGHSGYLDVILDLGLLGMLLISAFLFSSGARAAKLIASDWEWGSFWICLLLMLVIHSITESSLNYFTNSLMAVILFLHITFSKYCAIEATERET